MGRKTWDTVVRCMRFTVYSPEKEKAQAEDKERQHELG